MTRHCQVLLQLDVLSNEERHTLLREIYICRHLGRCRGAVEKETSLSGVNDTMVHERERISGYCICESILAPSTHSVNLFQLSVTITGPQPTKPKFLQPWSRFFSRENDIVLKSLARFHECCTNFISKFSVSQFSRHVKRPIGGPVCVCVSSQDKERSVVTTNHNCLRCST